MMGRDHRLVGLACTAVAAQLLQADDTAATLVHGLLQGLHPSAALLAGAGHLVHGLHLGDLALAAVGARTALWPDVDTESSTVGRELPRWWHRLTPGHRGFTHSFVWCAGVAALAYVVLAILMAAVTGLVAHRVILYQPLLVALTVAVLVGLLSHLAADMLTEHGAALLWPIRERLELPSWLPVIPFPTGSVRESMVTTLALVVTFCWLFNALPAIEWVVRPLLQ